MRVDGIENVYAQIDVGLMQKQVRIGQHARLAKVSVEVRGILFWGTDGIGQAFGAGHTFLVETSELVKLVKSLLLDGARLIQLSGGVCMTGQESLNGQVQLVKLLVGVDVIGQAFRRGG